MTHFEKVSTAKQLRYKPGAGEDNRVLAFALWLAWNSSCYWCGEQKSFDDMEIDHVVPQTRLDAAREKFKLPHDFDLHGLGNLAPICHGCNSKRKGNELHGEGVTLSWLSKAVARAERVGKAHSSITSRNATTESLVKIAQAPDDAETNRALESLGPAVVSRIAMVRPALASEFISTTVIEVPYPTTDPIDIPVILDAASRESAVLLEKLIGWACFDQLPDVLMHTLDDIEDLISAAIASEAGDFMPGAAGRETVHVEVTSLSADVESGAQGPRIQVNIEGTYTADHAASWFGPDDRGESVDKTVYAETVIAFSALLGAEWGEDLEYEWTNITGEPQTYLL